ncbi:hypothetical protein Hanom_Chr11g01019351 [Helianthus anomalus]
MELNQRLCGTSVCRIGFKWRRWWLNYSKRTERIKETVAVVVRRLMRVGGGSGRNNDTVAARTRTQQRWRTTLGGKVVRRCGRSNAARSC